MEDVLAITLLLLLFSIPFIAMAVWIKYQENHPFCDIERHLKLGYKHWMYANTKAEEYCMKHFHRHAYEEDVWEQVRERFGCQQLIQIYLYLDYNEVMENGTEPSYSVIDGYINHIKLGDTEPVKLN